MQQNDQYFSAPILTSCPHVLSITRPLKIKQYIQTLVVDKFIHGSTCFWFTKQNQRTFSYFSDLKTPLKRSNKKPTKTHRVQTWRLYIPSHNSQFVTHIHKHLAKSSFQRIQNHFLVPTPLILTQKTKMNFRKTSTLVIIFVICVSILGPGGVEATRVLSEDFGNANSLKIGSPISVKAEDIMAYWLQRLLYIFRSLKTQPN